MTPVERPLDVTDDDALRNAVRGIAPPTESDADDPVLDAAWQRIVADAPGVPVPVTSAAPRRRTRRWVVGLAAAACLGLATLAGVGAVGYFTTTSGGGASEAADVSVAGSTMSTDRSVAEPGMVAEAPAATAPGATAPGATEGQAAGAPATTSTPTTIASDASAVVATDDVTAARDEFVADVTALGGRVTGETVTGTGSSTPGGIEPATGMDSPVSSSSAIYPPWPTTPGISLSVEVPAAEFDQALAAARGLGEVVSFTRSSVDVGTSITDTDARIASLEASLARLRGLLDQATSLSDVISLENAIATRQAELDSLVAMRRDLASQTEQSRITLQLVTPEVAADYYQSDDPGFWQRALDIAGTVWLWLGVVLVVTSPIWLIGGGLWWWARRRRRGGSAA